MEPTYVQKFITPPINAINLVGPAFGISFCQPLCWKKFKRISFSALERRIALLDSLSTWKDAETTLKSDASKLFDDFLPLIDNLFTTDLEPTKPLGCFLLATADNSTSYQPSLCPSFNI